MQFKNELTKAVRVNLTPEDYALVSNHAAKKRTSISAVIRWGLIEYLGKTAV